MLSLYERIEGLCKQKGVNITTMCRESDVSRGSLTDLKSGRIKKLSSEALEKIASYFSVTVDFLLGIPDIKNTPTLTTKDERDISKRLKETLDDLTSQDGLMFDGEPLDDITRELLLSSLKNGLEMGKKLAKKKYTPKKYK